ncbi:AT-rich interactive domain-containing protein 2-like [Corylus avellana]|uniref:AT-rich interactive domain-containing protein 2-like n=1 Tax=Corylus avellana TaxID=13451 RepID=UPI00286B6154|nr:AT-rich interactive domain-containing protein 2-like [Corylus avellana]
MLGSGHGYGLGGLGGVKLGLGKATGGEDEEEWQESPEHFSDSSSLEEPNPKFQRALGIIDSIQNPVAVADFIDSAMRMISSGDHFCRPVIPIGPKFQAEIPEWTCLEKRKNLYGGDDDSENLKWLGTRIWPMEGRNTETTVKAVGKGRHDACSCVSPGSADCVKRHVLKERLRLQSDIGAAFRCWKFDEMGEEAVSKSWTLEEQSRFESLVKVNPLWKVANFWELALKRFPSKSMKSILSYYFNVFIPRRMSLQSKSSLETFDSDDDQADDEVPVEE